MTSSFPVKYVNNAMRGAPQLSGTAGTLIAALDAFLLTGFGQVTALSVTVAGGVATAALQPGLSFDPYCVVLVAGATPAALNGEARVLTASNSAITFATTAPDGVATGTITIKVAPVGQWEKLYAGTNKAVYRSTDPHASGFCLRVNDSGTTSASVRGFESMTDADTGTGPFPTTAQLSDDASRQWKSGAENAVAVRYDLIADSRFCLIAVAAGSSSGAAYTASPLRGFGDLLAIRPAGDGYAVAISCGNAFTYNTNMFPVGAFDASEGGGNAIYMARNASGIGSALLAGSRAYVGSSALVSGADSTLGAFPSVIDGELKYSRRYVHAGDGGTPRADVPGVLTIPQSGVISHVSPRNVLDGTGEFAGRALLALGCTNGSVGSPTTGICLVDITGPWRPVV